MNLFLILPDSSVASALAALFPSLFRMEFEAIRGRMVRHLAMVAVVNLNSDLAIDTSACVRQSSDWLFHLSSLLLQRFCKNGRLDIFFVRHSSFFTLRWDYRVVPHEVEHKFIVSGSQSL